MESTTDFVMENQNILAHSSPNPLRCPPAPLNQISPERMNQQRRPQSPSLQGYLAENERPRTRDSMTSEVQSKVAFLNSLSNPSSPNRIGRQDKTQPALGPSAVAATSAGNGWLNNNIINGNTNSAFQRAVMGYEEAQASLATLNAELERSKEELASRKKRERIIAQRVEMLLEELQLEKDKRVRDQESYAKEVKRCRKETYRAELALVESREELKEVRIELKKAQAEIQHEKSEKEKSRQEAFERAYALAGVLEDTEQLKDRLKAAEKERDTTIEEMKAAVEQKTVLENAQMSETLMLGTEPVQRSSKWLGDYEGRVVSNPSTVSEDSKPNQPLRSFTPLFHSFESIKFHLDIHDKQIEGEGITAEEEIEFLKQELKWAKRQHKEDEDLIHFMHMQCQFKACPCRIAESNGERFVHDHAYDAELQQRRGSKKRKISAETSDMKPFPKESVSPVSHADETRSAIPVNTTTHRVEVDPTVFPPEPTPEVVDASIRQPSQFDEALAIPLPEPQPMELDLRDETPEPTAQLEEITQVLVEPGPATKPFSFSTSTTSNAASRSVAPTLRHTENASAALEQDLFDLSPPKHAPPRRPSTAMGILTVDSPIRLVPDSPRSIRTTYDDYRRPASPQFEHNQMFAESTTTTKIALKDSSPRSSLHRRAQSRPNVRSHSPLVSSVMSQGDQTAPYSNYIKETSASPAATTLFPVTPLHRQARPTREPAHDEQAMERIPPQTIATTTTTTRVPLRGFGDPDDVFSPVRDDGDHAQTEVIRTHTFAREHAPTSSHPLHDGPISHILLDSKSSSILGNVPGTPISREAALAQIRARRDRARSVNLKRSTGSIAGLNTSSGKSPTKPRVVNPSNGAAGAFSRDKEGARREISQASAPGRFAC